jgi:hypothetical protein
LHAWIFFNLYSQRTDYLLRLIDRLLFGFLQVACR